MPVHSDADSLLQELRRGERDGFARYFEHYRASVYDLVRRLLREDEAAASATVEVFTRAYRDVLLRDDGVGLRALTCRAILHVCRERLDGDTLDGAATSTAAATAADRREETELGRRFGQALETLPFRFQAALLIHDVAGLRPGELASVFGVTEEAASALLFRAREEFRRAFEELSAARDMAGCRLAEQAAAGAVGRSPSADEVRRLHEHAAYCRPCRRTMKGWGDLAIGLALFLEVAPLPPALETTPVFGTAVPIAGVLGAAAGAGLFRRTLGQMGRTLKSRAAAYALAVTCLALAVGIAMQLPQGDRSFVLLSGVALRLPQSAPSATSGARPSPSRSSDAATHAPAAARPSAESDVASVSSAPDSAGSSADATEPASPVVAHADTSEPAASNDTGGRTPDAAATNDTGARPSEPAPTAVGQSEESAGGAQPQAGDPVASVAGAHHHSSSHRRVKKHHHGTRDSGHAASSSHASGRDHGDRAHQGKSPARDHSRQSSSHRDYSHQGSSHRSYSHQGSSHQSHSHGDHSHVHHTHEKSKKNS